MKTILIAFFAACVLCGAETADEIVRAVVPGFVAFDNGLDSTPEGRRRTALNNAEWTLQHYMASDRVPEGVRLAYVADKLREQMRTQAVYKEGTRSANGDFAFVVDESGAWVVDEEKTKIMRDKLAGQIRTVEQRLVELSNPQNKKPNKAEMATPRKPSD